MKKNILAVAVLAVTAFAFSAISPAALALPGCDPSGTSPKKCDPVVVIPDLPNEDLIDYVTDPSGISPIATYLQSDGGKRFGKRWVDFDIATELVLWVVKKDPSSPVSVLTDGNATLTMFVPTDGAFRKLVRNLTGNKLNSEEAVFKAVTSLGFDTVEKVLLYHVVPGANLASSAVLGLNSGSLATAEGSLIQFEISGTRIELIDGNDDLRNPIVELKKLNLNNGNLQIGHGIKRVLMP